MLEFSWSFNPYWRGFSHDDLELLAETLLFLKVGQGTTILKKGQRASFVAFISSGSADVIIGGNRVASIEAGESLGELAMFHGGLRMATVESANPATVVGLLTFDELRVFNTKHPKVALKLIKLLAFASESKLKQQVKREAEVKDDEPVPEEQQPELLENVSNALKESGTLLDELKPDELATLVGNMSVQEYFTGEPILKQGNLGQVLMLVLKGQVSVRLGGTHGRLVGSRNVGEFLGEVPYLERHHADLCIRDADAYAVLKTTVAVLKYNALDHFNITSPGLVETVFTCLAQQGVTRLQNILNAVEERTGLKTTAPKSKGTESILKKRKKKKKSADDKNLTEDEKKKLRAHKKANQMYLQMRKVKDLGKMAKAATEKAKNVGVAADPYKKVKSESSRADALTKIMAVQRYSKYCRGLKKDDVETILQEMPVLICHKGDTLCKKGEPSTFVLLVLSGSANVVVDQEDVHTFREGDFIGEYSAFDAGGRPADVVAAEKTYVVCIFLERLNSLFLKKPHLGLNLYKLFAYTSMSRTREECLEAEVSNSETAENLNIVECEPDLMKGKLEGAHTFPLESGRQGLGNLDRTDFEALSAAVKLATYSPGEQVFVKDTVGTSLAFVLDGSLVVHADGPESSVVGRCPRGSYIGEKAFIASQKGLSRRTADMFAEDSVEIAVISNEDFLNLSKENPYLVVRILRHLGNVVIQRLMAYHPSNNEKDDDDDDDKPSSSRKCSRGASSGGGSEPRGTGKGSSKKAMVDVNSWTGKMCTMEETVELLSACQQYSSF